MDTKDDTKGATEAVAKTAMLDEVFQVSPRPRIYDQAPELLGGGLFKNEQDARECCTRMNDGARKRRGSFNTGDNWYVVSLLTVH